MNKSILCDETDQHHTGTAAPILIPEGKYEAQCIKHHEFKQFRENSLCLKWSLIDARHFGVNLAQFFRMNYSHYKATTKYFTAWVIANNYVYPTRPTRKYMSPRIFENVIGIVTVRTVRPKFANGEPKPECFHYSVVDELLQLSVPNNGARL